MSAIITGTFTARFDSGVPSAPVSGTFSMNFSQAGVITELDGIKSAYDGGSLALYGGQAFPATPETAITGTELLSFTFASPAFGADLLSGGQTVTSATFVTSDVQPLASGIATFARARRADGTTALSDHIVAAPWQPSATVVANQSVVLGGKLYRCTAPGVTAASGGPSGTGASIIDGAATWTYVGLSSAAVLIFNTTTITRGVPSTMTSFSLSTGAPIPETLTIATPPATLTGIAIPLSGTYASGPPAALDYSTDGITWTALGAPTIANLTWSGTGPTFSVANPAQTVSIRDHAQTDVTATSGAFAVTSPVVTETLTIITPVGAVANAAVPMSGTWTTVQPTLFEYSINAGGTWNPCSGAATIVSPSGTWQTTGPTFIQAKTGIVIVVRDRSHPTVQATTGAFNVAAPAPLPETLTITTPAGVRVGTSVPLSGSYTNGPPPSLDYSLDGTTWIALGAPVVIGVNSWSGTGPTFGAPVAAQTISIRDHVTTTITAISGSFSVTAAPLETLSVTTPQSAFINQPLTLNGAYTNGPPVAFDYSTDGGTTWFAMTAPSVANGLWSAIGPTFTAVLASVTVAIRDHNAPSITAVTNAFAVTLSSGAAVMTDAEGHAMTDTETPTPDQMVGP